MVPIQLTVAAFQDVKSDAEALKTLQLARLIGISDQPGVVFAALRPIQGTVCQTTLPYEAVEALKEELEKID